MVREHVRDYLYFHPMRPAQGQKEYRVLIHGWSEEAEAFADLCMQQGQWPGTLLSVCVETDIETDYLKKRPALINYVDCGNNTPDELLARLRFVKDAEEEEWDYVFDPGQMEDDLKTPEDLERYAFNVHLVWEGYSDPDIPAELERYKELSGEYFRQSSMDCAAAMCRWIEELGISVNTPGAADEFEEAISGKNRQSLIKTIAQREHRRWVIERVTLGWQGIDLHDKEKREDYYAKCIERGSIRDEDSRIHPCLSGTGLEEVEFFAQTFNEYLYECADSIRRDRLVENSVFRRIKEAIDKLPNEQRDRISPKWRLFSFAVLKIMDGSKAYSEQYFAQRQAFMKAAEGTSARDKIESELGRLDRFTYPFRKLKGYHDYSRITYRIIEKIPFILTYRTDRCLAASFKQAYNFVHMNDNIMQNLAMVTAVRPARIVRLVYIHERSSRRVMSQMLSAAEDYRKSKKLRGETIWLIGFSHNLSSPRMDAWKSFFAERPAKEGEYRICESIGEPGNKEKLLNEWITAMKALGVEAVDLSEAPFKDAVNNASFVEAVKAAFPVFRYDVRGRKFLCEGDAGHLRFLPDRSFLRVDEMFALAGGSDKLSGHPEILIRDYRKLWEIYIGAARNMFRGKYYVDKVTFETRSWNILCASLGAYFNKKKNEDDSFDVREMENTWRGAYHNNILHIISELRQAKLILPAGGRSDDNNGRKQDQIYRFRDREMKRLMTKAGDVLEICVYYAACESGLFDDAESGYHWLWSDKNVENELDLIVTKGYRSAFVECKARAELTQDYYLTLGSLEDMFGIDAVRILLTTAELGENHAPAEDQYGKELEMKRQANRLQARRGKMMDVMTIRVTENDTPDQLVRQIYDLMMAGDR